MPIVRPENRPAYCSVSDVGLILQATTQDIVRIGSEERDNLTEEQADQYIRKVENRLDARIAFKYSVPLAIPVDDIVKQIAEYRTAYDIYVVILSARGVDVIPENIKAWAELADGLERDIVEGRISLSVAPAEDVGRRASTSHIREAREVQVSLVNDEWSAIGYEFIVKESFIARVSEDATTQYTQGTDYTVDWRQGLMRRVTPGSSIPSGQTVWLWFLYLETEIFQENLRRDPLTTREGYF